MIPESPIPSSNARPADLTDAEFDELDGLLRRTPEPLVPLDPVMLDGFLCGMLVQPVTIELQDALRWVFDEEGRPLPAEADAVWLRRATELVAKREAALRRAIVEDGGFDPLLDDPEAELDDGDDAAPSPHDASTDALPDAPTGPVQAALLPWVAGFGQALERFPALLDLDDDAVSFALARVFRHLPPEDADAAEVVATLDREMPLADLDDAVNDLVDAVVELVALTEDERYRVQQVRRETPKVGRNDPCPCGSGKKYKLCHGRG